MNIQNDKIMKGKDRYWNANGGKVPNHITSTLLQRMLLELLPDA